jgi:hypothetical protein
MDIRLLIVLVIYMLDLNVINIKKNKKCFLNISANEVICNLFYNKDNDSLITCWINLCF